MDIDAINSSCTSGALEGPAELVVVGLGYVGLPLAYQAKYAGIQVVGLDVSETVVTTLNAGESHIDDLTHHHIADMRATGFTATTDPRVLKGAATIVICVPTPLSSAGEPDLTAVRAAATSIAGQLEPGTLVILESTTYPGTTAELLRPLLETSGLTAGRDFHLAFSPERIDPGNPFFGVSNTPKVVGGLSQRCGDTAAAFYGKFIESVVQARGTREAEMAKLLENTYRHVNIALINEMAVFCHELDIDLWDTISCAATKPFGFQTFYPGPGVGGHCIPVDPNYLSYKVKTLGYPFRFVELAQDINARMPSYVVQRAQKLLNEQGLPLSRSRVVLLGVTYKADIADQRESPARPVAQELRDAGAVLSYHDPHVAEWIVANTAVPRAQTLDEALAHADLAIVLAGHREYTPAALTEHNSLVLDTRGILRRSAPRDPSTSTRHTTEASKPHELL